MPGGAKVHHLNVTTTISLSSLSALTVKLTQRSHMPKIVRVCQKFHFKFCQCNVNFQIPKFFKLNYQKLSLWKTTKNYHNHNEKTITVRDAASDYGEFLPHWPAKQSKSTGYIQQTLLTTNRKMKILSQMCFRLDFIQGPSNFVMLSMMVFLNNGLLSVVTMTVSASEGRGSGRT